MSVPESPRFTYEDYVLLPEDRRYEVTGLQCGKWRLDLI